jgi:hypothetical protein
MIARLVMVVAMIAVLPVPVAAQHVSSHDAHTAVVVDDSVLARFIAQARAGTQRYRDRTVAIEEGFRPVGPDFPGMGEHWINVGRLLSARFDPERPALLQYATIAGRPTLVGVTYALGLTDGDSLPTFPSRTAWHQHRGTVDEESLLDQHALDQSDIHGGRVAMLHAWVWLDNPDGLFHSDNWALPFVRLSLVAGDPVHPDVGRALSLLTGGDEYHAVALTYLGAATGADSIVIRTTIASARARVETLLATNRESRLTQATLDELAAIWKDMWVGLEDRVSASVREKLSLIKD